DLEGIDENAGMEVIPPGTYEFEVAKAEYGESKAGNPMITLQLKIDDREGTSIEDGGFNGRRLFYHITLHKQFGLQQLKKTILAIAPDVPLKGFDPEKADVYFEGRRGRARVGTQKYEGELRNNVK